jgi:TonB-linked SusC/RagA family outer membrane protein
MKKVLITMKLTTLLLSVNLLCMAAGGYTQSERLSIDKQNVTIKEVLLSIENQSNYKFLYRDADIEDKIVSLSSENSTINELLDSFLPNSGNTYRILDNNLIVIMPYEAKQELEITGTVKDGNTGAPMPGVNIIEKGTQNGTATNVDGNYSIVVSNEDAVLVFSFVGYLTEEISVAGKTAIDVILVESIESLDEIVVIGYGSVKKRELTGSVASVKERDFNQGAVTYPLQLIQGKVAGLSVTRTNGGDPTSNFEIRLRGSSSLNASEEPLIVIDGIPGGNLESVAPEDIESIDILKDGSAAAIYGTRGTNGVILITTKTGSKTRGMEVEYSAKFYTETALRKFDVLTAEEYRAIKDTFLNSGIPAKVNLANSMIDYGDTTDWWDEITRTPFSHMHHLAISNGSEKGAYRLSLNYSSQEGILLNSSREEYRVALNMNQLALNDRMNFNVQLGLSNNKNHPVDYNAVRQVLQRNPTEPVYNEDGSLFEIVGAWQYENPVGILTERVRDTSITFIYGNVGVDLNITDELKIGALTGLHINRSLNGYYEPSYSLPQESAATGGYAQRESAAGFTKTFESTLEWKKHLASHNINLIGGYSFQEFVREGFDASNSDFITDDVEYNNLGLGTYLSEGRAAMSSFKEKSNLVAFFARGAYNFKGKYFISASVRREGSSKFGINNKWGTFPAVSAAWDISNENFMSGLNIQLLKLRAGYGVTGNSGLDPYLSVTRLGLLGQFYYGGQYLQAIAPVSNPNPDLKWETKHEYDIGIDWLILNSRLGGTVDAYIRDTKDLLHTYNVPQPPNLHGSTLANVCSMRNKGIELTINAVPVKTSKLEWLVDFNINYLQNTLLSLSNKYYSLDYVNVGDVGPPGISAWTHRYEEGEPIGNIHTYVYEGIDSLGQWVFRDYNRSADTIGGNPVDGKINTQDRDVVGNGIPDWYLGLTTTLRYRNFDLTVMCRGMFGHQIINAKRIWHENPKFLPRNVFAAALETNLWDDPEFSSYYVEDGDFVKVDNITLGYTMNFNNEWINRARVYFTGTSLFLITGYKGLDPEVAIGGLEPGNDNRFDYPSTRTFLIGFNVTF